MKIYNYNKEVAQAITAAGRNALGNDWWQHRESENPNPDPDLKGKKGGNCNRTACQMPLRKHSWYNSATHAYYCTKCARMINESAIGTLGKELCTREDS